MKRPSKSYTLKNISFLVSMTFDVVFLLGLRMLCHVPCMHLEIMVLYAAKQGGD